jgi:hypothetical protein
VALDASLSLTAAIVAMSLVPAAPAHADVIALPDLLRGIVVSREACARTELAVWVEVLGRAFCMRYYLSDVGGTGARPLVMLQGDQLGRADLDSRTFIPRPDATGIDTDALARRAANLSRSTGTPAIYLARVGLDGSSGHHIVRRTLLELQATNAALTAIKVRHGFEGFHLVGQSGGATLAAGLLGLRDDIGCAALGSGRLSAIGNRADLEDPDLAFFDPSDRIDASWPDRARVFVVTDPEDKIVRPSAQTGLVARLGDAGRRATQFFVTATDENRHSVSAYATLVAANCMRDQDDETIRYKLDALVARRVAAAQERNASRANSASASGEPTPQQDAGLAQ